MTWGGYLRCVDASRKVKMVDSSWITKKKNGEKGFDYGGGSYMEDVVSRYPLRISLTAISNAVKFLNCISLWSEGGARGQMRKPGASRSNWTFSCSLPPTSLSPFWFTSGAGCERHYRKKTQKWRRRRKSPGPRFSLSLHFIYRCNINITCVLYIYIYNTCRYVPRSLWLISVSLWCVGDWLTSTAKGKPLRNTQGHGGGIHSRVETMLTYRFFFSLSF